MGLCSSPPATSPPPRTVGARAPRGRGFCWMQNTFLNKNHVLNGIWAPGQAPDACTPCNLAGITNPGKKKTTTKTIIFIPSNYTERAHRGYRMGLCISDVSVWEADGDLPGRLCHSACRYGHQKGLAFCDVTLPSKPEPCVSYICVNRPCYSEAYQ